MASYFLCYTWGSFKPLALGYFLTGDNTFGDVLTTKYILLYFEVVRTIRLIIYSQPGGWINIHSPLPFVPLYWEHESTWQRVLASRRLLAGPLQGIEDLLFFPIPRSRSRTSSGLSRSRSEGYTAPEAPRPGCSPLSPSATVSNMSWGHPTPLELPAGYCRAAITSSEVMMVTRKGRAVLRTTSWASRDIEAQQSWTIITL